MTYAQQAREIVWEEGPTHIKEIASRIQQNGLERGQQLTEKTIVACLYSHHIREGAIIVIRNRIILLREYAT